MDEQDLAARVAALEARLEQTEQRLGAKLDHVSRRLEEITAFFASRTSRMMHAQSIYLGDYTALTFLETGQRAYVDTRSRDIGLSLLTTGRWEGELTDLFRRLVKPGHTVFDIGANHGFYALHAAKLTGPTGRVEAFEPNPRMADLAAASLRANGFGWARVHTVGVGDTAGHAILTCSTQTPGSGHIRARPQPGRGEASEVAMVVLDEMFPDPAFTVDVIKMDIEGYEGRALRGMARLLERSPRVFILMEFEPGMMAHVGVSASEVAAQFQGLGMSAWIVGPKGALEAVSWGRLANRPPGIVNVLVSREAPG